MEKEKYKQEINKLINAEPNKIRKYTRRDNICPKI